jgi:hypothetical protein
MTKLSADTSIFQRTYYDKQDNDSVGVKSLHVLLREFYKREKLNSKGTLIIGANDGSETENTFDGTLLDINFEACQKAAAIRPLARVKCANAIELPFKDNEFDYSVLSLVLSQINSEEPACVTEAYAEALRVSKYAVWIVDTTERITISSYEDKNKDTKETEKYFSPIYLDPVNIRKIGGSFEWEKVAPILQTSFPGNCGITRDPTGISYTVEIFAVMKDSKAISRSQSLSRRCP